MTGRVWALLGAALVLLASLAPAAAKVASNGGCPPCPFCR
jgi:hypothetical protein